MTAIEIDRLPYEITATDTEATEVNFIPGIEGPTSNTPGNKVVSNKTLVWLVTVGTYKLSIGKAIDANTPGFLAGTNDKMFCDIKSNQILYVQATTIGDKIIFTMVDSDN